MVKMGFKADVIRRFPTAACKLEQLERAHLNARPDLRLKHADLCGQVKIWTVRDAKSGAILGVTDHWLNGANTAWKHAYSRIRSVADQQQVLSGGVYHGAENARG